MTRESARKPAAKPAKPTKPAAKRGRPRSRLPADVVARLGPCPADPLARQHWMHAMLGEILGLQAIGAIDSTLASELRATISAANRAIPMETLLEVDRRMQADEEAIDADDRGPQMKKRKPQTGS